MPKEQKPRSHPEPTVSPQKGKSKKKTSSSSKDESFMQFYPSTTHRVSEKIKAKIRANPLLMASWKASAEGDYGPDYGDPVLGVREHLALAATCTALRRCYHHNDVWHDIRRVRCIPKNGRRVPLESSGGRIPPDSKRMLHLATSPQKKKAHGPYFKELADAYGSHRYSIKNCWEHRIFADLAKKLYPLVTDEHLKHLHFFEENHRGYPNQWTEEGYAEVCVEWMSYRIKAGLA